MSAGGFVYLVGAGPGGSTMAAYLADAGLDVLLDDRKASPGVKFTDAEILGVPTAVVVGRGLADGLIEVRDRASGERSELSVHGATEALVALHVAGAGACTAATAALWASMRERRVPAV